MNLGIILLIVPVAIAVLAGSVSLISSLRGIRELNRKRAQRLKEEQRQEEMIV